MPKRNRTGGKHARKSVRRRYWRESLRAIMEPVGEAQTALDIDIGGRLRGLRTERGLSIRTLADMSGLNFNTLSLIENEKTSPSVSTLQRLAQALQVPISVFFEAASMQPDVVYQKFNQRPQAKFVHGFLEDLGAGLTLGEGVPLLLTLEPGADSGVDAIVHTGQEFVYCLEGHLNYLVADEEYVLNPGDSLIFQAHLPHQWGNQGSCVCRSILILCPTDENDLSAQQHFMSEKKG